jgi:cytochrome P450
MDQPPAPEWNPKSQDVLRDQRAAYDAMRERCPVAYSDFMQWSLFRHADVLRVLQDHETFCNAVSHHLSVPNGMDPPEHTVYRAAIEPYFAAPRMQAFEPVCRDIAAALVRKIAGRETELMADLALPFAVRTQCAFLGWPPELDQALVGWTRRNYEAILAQDRQAMSELAREFQGFIDGLLKERLESGAQPEGDLMTALMQEKVWGRPLSNEEIASILRNWTVGEVGTMSASVGILAHHLAQDRALQHRLRAEPTLLGAANDEILRVFGPLVANRRIAKRPVEIAGRRFEAGERFSLNWIAANRDGRAFEDAEQVKLERDPSRNLLYGAGIHVCPGAPLARLELRVMMEELLAASSAIEPVPGKPPRNAVYPGSGFASLPLFIRA